MQNRPPEPAPGAHACQPTRLAESPIATVDRCTCGVILLHLGALTLRFAPGAALELLATLDDAMARHAAEGSGASSISLALRAELPRGQA